MAETKKRATAKKATRRRKVAPTYDQIAARAYELYAAGTGGDALEHWLRAERELATA